MHEFKSFLQNHIQLSQDDWDIILPEIETIETNKFDTLTEANSIEQKVYFVVEGVLRLYFDADEKEITLNFAFPNSFISSYSSFLRESNSEFVLECLSECKLVLFTKKSLEKLYSITECGQKLGRLFAEQIFLYLSDRETDFMLKSPTQRYLDLFEKQPHLIQEIPQKYLASYIGITPQALSRIRAKM